MTRATALFLLCFPGDEEVKSISLDNGRKLCCRRDSGDMYIVGTYRQGPLYEWYYLIPQYGEDEKIAHVTAVSRDGSSDPGLQHEWEQYAASIIESLSEARKKKLEKMI